MIPRIVPVFFLALFASLASAAERPNIILVMVDDMGFSDLGYHGGEIETPRTNRLSLYRFRGKRTNQKEKKYWKIQGVGHVMN